MSTDKFKALVHFIVHSCQDNPSRLGAIRLNKILWYTDVIAYKLNGVPLTGETYKRRKNGPVPAHILATLDELKADEKIAIREPEYQFDSRKYISLLKPETNHLSEDERNMALKVLESVCGFTANGISEMTHDLIWDAAEDGEEIPLYATLVSEKGNITDEVKSWASSMLTASEEAVCA